MTRAELKAKARERLGNGIFKNEWMMALLICLIVGAVISLAGTIIRGIGIAIVAGPMLFAQDSIFLKNARDGESVNLADLLQGFRTDFGGTFLIGLMSGIFTFLWGLLLVVPGIVKAYSYSMAYYVKADHPDYGWNECLKESMRLMQGHKWQKFVLDLSFLGWGIVGVLCLGIGTLWVTPYLCATDAQFYESIRQDMWELPQ